ncbi:GNAT family N-acetyltransferase [Aquimarina sp. MMG016]|uniref:GNAT family N-acetyltransferase n=1 Tax=Aquimarina sp. MMG016 TaxID=2822690 RepID=UPI001B39E654|nr:GNAT family N-acetyltransferase [Aquimarina sp. MMG016]MBQ4818921.1 GNAT family N-acetyltransferase [Aquimarina sp. MMG016]
MKIREARLDDEDSIWEIFKSVIKTGDTYVFDPKTKKESLSKLWFASYMQTYVLEENDKILGTYIIKPNQIDLGSHIANCSYMVHPNAQGKGVGKMLCEHSLELAKKVGYKAIQFNIVVSTNTPAIRLWKKYGFEIIGTIPKGFKHSSLGYVDAYIMFREL